MRFKKVIFIDPGITLGWAVFQTPQKRSGSSIMYHISSGAETLPHELGRQVTSFFAKLQNLVLVADRPSAQDTLMAWEESAFSRFHTASRMYGMWEGLLILFCEKTGLSYVAVNGATIKAYARKQLHCAKKGKPWARNEWRLQTAKQDEVDARWGLEYVLKLLREEKEGGSDEKVDS